MWQIPTHPRQIDKIVAEVTKHVRKTQVEESDGRQEGNDLPIEIYEGLEEPSPTELQRALQKFKRGTHKYNNQEWFKETKVDTAQLVNTIYRLTKNTRVQAKAATELYEHPKYIMDRGLQQEDLQIFQDSIEQSSRLAVYGFGLAKQQENKANEITTKALRLLHSIKHLEITLSNEKRFTFDETFVEQYYNKTYKQRLTSGSAISNHSRENKFRSGKRGANGINEDWTTTQHL
ncbi:hypothetical protein K501DRAFT_284394, partial [Backusella circina FSU 941]